MGKEFKEETNGAETLLLFSIKFPEKKYKDILYQSPAYISPHLFVLPSEASAVSSLLLLNFYFSSLIFKTIKNDRNNINNK